MTKILVVGAGAVGGLFSSKLGLAGAEVTMVCRSDYEEVNKNGLQINSHWGNFSFTPKSVLKNIAEYQEKADFILVATKVLPEISVADLIRPALHSGASIVLLQNGIHIEKPIAALFPNHHLISMIAHVCVSKSAPGIIDHKELGRLAIGDYPKGVSAKTRQLIELWQKSGVPCEVSENIQIDRWKKLIWNAAFNPISVLAGGIDTQKILANPEAEKLVRNVMQEVCILARADGCELPENIVEQNVSMTKKMHPYKTSMLLDFEAKRKMEVEAILGNAVRFAEEKSLTVPYLSSLRALLSCY